MAATHRDESLLPDSFETPHTRANADRTVESLYTINKAAKKYARLACEAYDGGRKTTAKANSLKKKALYSLKASIIQDIISEATDIEAHIIDGRDYYLVRFGQWSFHVPVDDVALPDSYTTETTTIDDFSVTETQERTDQPLKDALLFFEREFERNANEHLEQKRLYWGNQSYFIGWEYLGPD